MRNEAIHAKAIGDVVPSTIGRWWGFSLRPPTVRGRIVTGFALLVFTLVAVTGVSTWLVLAHQAEIADLESHSTTASLLQEAEAQAGIAALLLQRYVISDDQSLIPEIQTHATAAVESLSQAVVNGGVADVSDIAVGGASLAEGASGIIALQQSGDKETTATAMEEIVPVFREFRLELEAATALELEEIAALRERSDRTGEFALWLLILSGAIGAAMGMAASFLIARSIIRPLSSLEATATAVKAGDLTARSRTSDPRELAHLGTTLNDMVEAVERRTAELSLANRQLMERNRQLSDVRVQAATDPLTGLGNHRTFHQRIRDEIASAEGNGAEVGLILLDIDAFKAVNDSRGHMAGDEVLHRLAHTIGDVASQEHAYRYGGDEFAVLLPGADVNRATHVAEALRAAVQNMSAHSGAKVTISLGVASFPRTAASAEELIYKADMAMYWAKSTGKNRVGDWDGLLSRRSNGDPPESYDIRDCAEDTVVALVATLAGKDPITRDHSERCAWYAGKLAEELGLDDEEAVIVRLAALLHDVGKLVIPDEVLCKPGPLDEQEWAIMRQHPTTATHILSSIESTASAVPAILHHHEHFDGSGYPHGLAGEDIPMASRILLVTDAFDAMTTDRPYRKAMPVEEAIEELKRKSGSQFDPAIVEAFLRMISRAGAHPLRSPAAAAGPAPGVAT